MFGGGEEGRGLMDRKRGLWGGLEMLVLRIAEEDF
jgi:hypothetical protein